jgi:hypothetical protein
MMYLEMKNVPTDVRKRGLNPEVRGSTKDTQNTRRHLAVSQHSTACSCHFSKGALLLFFQLPGPAESVCFQLRFVDKQIPQYNNNLNSTEKAAYLRL